MKIRDEFVNDINSAIQTYTKRYSKFADIPEERRRDIQQVWSISEEKNPLKLRKRLEKKLNTLADGFWLFFMLDLKRFKLPLMELLSRDQYQKDNLKARYEREISSYSAHMNQDDIFHLVGRVDQLETKVTKYEKKTLSLELEVKRLTKENDFLTNEIQKLYIRNQQLEADKRDAMEHGKQAQEKLHTMEDKYKQLLEENARLKKQLTSVQFKASTNSDYLEIAKPRSNYF